MRSGEIGPGKAGGLRRLALTDADKEMRDLFITWCTEAGCTVQVDRRRQHLRAAARRGRSPAAGADGQPPRHAGRGRQVRRHRRRAGRVSRCCRALDDRRVRTQASAGAGLLDQRGGRALHPPMVASGAFAGVFDVDWVLGAARRRRQRVRRASWSASAITARPPVGGRGIDAYFELHIEQGPILDRETVPVGIVVGGYATRGMHVDVLGETAHAGPTPMDRPAQRAGGRGHAGGGRQRHRLEVPRHRGQGHRGRAWWPGPTRPASSPSTPSSPATCATPTEPTAERMLRGE